MVSPQLAEQFKKILAEDYGREVSVDEASQILDDMTAYFDLLARLNHESVTENIIDQTQELKSKD